MLILWQKRNRRYKIYLQRCQGALNQTIKLTSGLYWPDTCCNKGQKTTFGSQFITHVLTNLSVNFSQGLRAMTRRFCAPWGKSFSAILQASTTSKLYQISMVWIVTCYQVRSQSLKTTTARMHIREKTQL